MGLGDRQRPSKGLGTPSPRAAVPVRGCRHLWQWGQAGPPRPPPAPSLPGGMPGPRVGDVPSSAPGSISPTAAGQPQNGPAEPQRVVPCCPQRPLPRSGQGGSCTPRAPRDWGPGETFEQRQLPSPARLLRPPPHPQGWQRSPVGIPGAHSHPGAVVEPPTRSLRWPPGRCRSHVLTGSGRRRLREGAIRKSKDKPGWRSRCGTTFPARKILGSARGCRSSWRSRQWGADGGAPRRSIAHAPTAGAAAAAGPLGRVFKADLPQQPLPGRSGSASRGEPARSGSPGLAAPGRACPPPGFGVAVARASLPRPRARHVPATSLSQSERRGKRAGSGGTPIPRGQRPPEKGVSGRKGSAPSPRAARRRRRRQLKPVLYGESNGRRHRRLPEEAGGRDGHREPGLAGGSHCPESGEGGTRGGEQPRPEPRGRGPGADNGNPIWCPISWARNGGGQRRAGQTDG